MTAPRTDLDLVEVRAFCHDLADLADAITTRWQDRARGDREVWTKTDGTPVTAADREVEATLRAAIAARFPGHAVLGEEEGRVGPADAPTWIVDPIDGTKNFAAGIPAWATLVALAVDDVEVVGLVSAPALGARFDGIVDAAARTRGFGDFWHHCLVAEGAIDAALEAVVSRWDLAAVRVVVEAAGGRFTDLAGRPTTSGGSACSSNGHVHDAVLGALGTT